MGCGRRPAGWLPAWGLARTLRGRHRHKEAARGSLQSGTSSALRKSPVATETGTTCPNYVAAQGFRNSDTAALGFADPLTSGLKEPSPQERPPEPPLADTPLIQDSATPARPRGLTSHPVLTVAPPPQPPLTHASGGEG